MESTWGTRHGYSGLLITNALWKSETRQSDSCRCQAWAHVWFLFLLFRGRSLNIFAWCALSFFARAIHGFVCAWAAIGTALDNPCLACEALAEVGCVNCWPIFVACGLCFLTIVGCPHVSWELTLCYTVALSITLKYAHMWTMWWSFEAMTAI